MGSVETAVCIQWLQFSLHISIQESAPESTPVKRKGGSALGADDLAVEGTPGSAASLHLSSLDCVFWIAWVKLGYVGSR
jgi:hypothetical protein